MNRPLWHALRVATSVERLPTGSEEAWLLARPTSEEPKGVHRARELLPDGYAAYFRLFHPFVPWAETPSSTAAPSERRRWVSLAEAAGADFHAELTWRTLEPVLPVQDDARPYAVSEGEIEPQTRAELFAALPADDSTAFFYYGLAASIFAGGPMLYRADRAAVNDVAAQADTDAGRHIAGPEYVWAQDRSWVVATDYDLTSTYIACSDEAASRLAAHAELEVLLVTLGTRIDNGADLRNGTGYLSR